MAYTTQTWVNSGASGGLGATSEVNAERLAYMEEGIEAAHELAEAVPADVMLAATYGGGTAVRPDPVENGLMCHWVCTTSAVPPVVGSGTAGRAAGDIVDVAQ